MRRKISVVITHINEVQNLWFTIQNTIDELVFSNIDFEIIVVDNGSNGPEIGWVKKMVENFGKYHDVRLVEYKKRGGCSGVRITGIMEAKNDLICFMDCHVLVRRGYFNSMIPLFDDPDVYIVNAPQSYYSQLLYEYPMNSLLLIAQSPASTFDTVSDEPYPICGQCLACTMIRKDILKFFFPEDELNYIPYSMDEPSPHLRAWMFGKKTLMNPKTSYAHTVWRDSAGRTMDFEFYKPMIAFALGGQEYYEESVKYWRIRQGFPDFKFELPYKDREFVEKNAKVKLKDLEEYLRSQGVKR